MKKIYIVTVVEFGNKYLDKEKSADGRYHSYFKRTKKDQEEYFTIRDSRACEWFNDLAVAKECVEHNSCDYHEQQYNMIVIEEVPEAMIGLPTKEYWYKWVGGKDEGKYVPAEKPDAYKNVVKFW